MLSSDDVLILLVHTACLTQTLPAPRALRQPRHTHQVAALDVCSHKPQWVDIRCTNLQCRWPHRELSHGR